MTNSADQPLLILPDQPRTPWGFNGLGEIVYLRTYSRDLPELGRRETWPETIERVIRGAREINARLTPAEEAALYDHLFYLRGVTAGRALWQLGTPMIARFGQDSLLNCYFTNISSVDDFVWLMQRLMVGGGVGFSIEREIVHDLPKVKGAKVTHQRTDDADFIVPDTRQGWGELLRRTLEAHFAGQDFTYSTLLVREAGAPLKTFGGTASGAGALIDGIRDISAVLNARAGNKLRSIDALDIANIIGRVVVAGSARRSAQIALGDPDDLRFLKAKRWADGNVPAWRGNSNNTIVANSFDDIPHQFWANGFDGGGETYGLFNRRLARTVGRLGERRADPSVVGCNPCFSADTRFLTVDGWRTFAEMAGRGVEIVQDARVRGRLDADGVERWDVEPSENGTVTNLGRDVRITARGRQLYRLTMSDGRSVRATDDHHFATPSGMVMLRDLKVGDDILVALPDVHVADRSSADWRLGYLLGLVASDGHVHDDIAFIALWGEAGWLADESGRIAALASSTIGELAIAEPALAASAGSRPVQLEPRFGRAAPSEAGVEKRLLRSRVLGALMAERGWSKGELGWLHYQKRDFKAGFVSGLLYGDGSVQDSNGSISWRLGPADRAFLTDVQLVLQELGVRASVLARKPAGVAMLPDGRGGRQAYATRAMFELIISGRRQCERAAIALEVPPHHRQRWDSLMERYHNAAYRDPDTSKVVSIELDAVEDVWCLSEDVRRTLVAEGLTARRCSEISLAHREACNLAEIFLPNITSFEQFTEVSRILYKIQKATALLPHPDPSTQAIVHRNLRLGQSISGVLQATEEQRSWVGPGYEALRAFDAEWSRELGVRDSVKLTSVKPSGCRPWDALTATDQGILTLQELLADHRDGETWSELRSGARVIHDDGRTAAISRSFVNGESETVRIKLNYGLELVSTPEHPWWVEQHIDRSRELKRQPVGKWVRAKDIAVDDVLSVNPGVYQNTEHARLPRVPMTALRMRHDVGAIQQPETMTADLAWLIGYLWGASAQSPARWRIRFTDERLENLQKAMRIVSEQFGLRGVITSKKNNGAFDLTFASAELWHWLIAQGVWKYAPGGGLDLIPEIVRRSASEDIVAFIAGLLDSDGWVGLAGPKSSLKTLLTTADQAFAKHVQHVALAVGLVFGRSVQQPETQSAGRWGRRPHVNMALSGHSTPTAVALLRRHSTRLSRMPAAVSIADGHLIIGKVVAVEAGERVPTYDIEVPDGNWFYAGAVKSHNTASLLPGVTPGIHGAYARHYIRRVRFGEHSPLVDMCRMRGYPVTYDIGLDGREDHTRFVVEFPAQAPEGTPIAGEMSAVEQLRWLTWAQREWADNQVSITVTFRDAEVPEIKAWLAEHYDREVKSVSFLRYEDHGFRLPPYEPISEEEYQRRVAAIRTIKGAVGVSLENELDPEECASGACPVR